LNPNSFDIDESSIPHKKSNDSTIQDLGLSERENTTYGNEDGISMEESEKDLKPKAKRYISLSQLMKF
jgi:hypothetical protein